MRCGGRSAAYLNAANGKKIFGSPNRHRANHFCWRTRERRRDTSQRQTQAGSEKNKNTVGAFAFPNDARSLLRTPQLPLPTSSFTLRWAEGRNVARCHVAVKGRLYAAISKVDFYPVRVCDSILHFLCLSLVPYCFRGLQIDL